MRRSIEKWQIKIIYATARRLGIAEQDNKQDNLHLLVEQRTGKKSIKDLNYSEASEIINQLKGYTNKQQESPGRITIKQSKMCWAMIYKLAELTPNSITPAERLAGAVHKILGMPQIVSNPLKWVTFEQGEKLIEYLKRYVRSAERRANENKQG